MEHIVTVALEGFAVALALVGFLVPLAERLRLPLPTVVALLGLAAGVVWYQLGGLGAVLALEQYQRWLAIPLELDGHAILAIFLPALLFEMALAVNVRRLREDLPIVILMAVVAVLTATLFIGGALHLASGLSLVICLLLGATLSTTDPAAVITIFRELGAPRRLLVILEGESLLNDAAAIALYTLLLASLGASTPPGVTPIVQGFLHAFGLGAVVGAGLGYLAARLLPWLRGAAAAEMSLTLALAYGAYLLAERTGASGVVAVVMAALVTSALGAIRMGPGNWPAVLAIWAQIGFWANAFILLLGALLAPHLITDWRWRELLLLAVVVASAFAARALILFVMLPALSRLGLSAPVTFAQKTLIWWGGVRGAVTLVLVFSLSEAGGLGPDERSLLGTLGCGFVLVTLLVNAASLAPVTRWLGLDRLSPRDRSLRERIVAGTMREAAGQIAALAAERAIAPAEVAELEASYRQRVEEIERRAPDGGLAFGERLRLGLTILAGQESRILRRQFEAGVIGPDITQLMRTNAEELADATRVGGRTGYRARMAQLLEFPPSFRLALFGQRWLRFERPLARMLSRRFDLLFETETMLQALCKFNQASMPPLIGEDATENLQQLLDQRLQLVAQHLDALELQYPSYAKALRQAFLQRAGLRWEEVRYDRLFREGIVGAELHRALIDEARRLSQASETRPRLDVGLDPARLIAAVPLFSELDAKDQRWLRRRLRSRLVAPGDAVVRQGERGFEMYFIGSGALEVRLAPEPIRLKTGNFFGELAILSPARRRTADVVALGFCRLLVLRRRDFRKLLARHAGLAEKIKAAAAARSAQPRLSVTRPDAATS